MWMKSSKNSYKCDIEMTSALSLNSYLSLEICIKTNKSSHKSSSNFQHLDLRMEKFLTLEKLKTTFFILFILIKFFLSHICTGFSWNCQLCGWKILFLILKVFFLVGFFCHTFSLWCFFSHFLRNWKFTFLLKIKSQMAAPTGHLNLNSSFLQ